MVKSGTGKSSTINITSVKQVCRVNAHNILLKGDGAQHIYVSLEFGFVFVEVLVFILIRVAPSLVGH